MSEVVVTNESGSIGAAHSVFGCFLQADGRKRRSTPEEDATGIIPSRARAELEPSRAEPSRAEPSRAEPSRAEPSRARSPTTRLTLPLHSGSARRITPARFFFPQARLFRRLRAGGGCVVHRPRRGLATPARTPPDDPGEGADIVVTDCTAEGHACHGICPSDRVSAAAPNVTNSGVTAPSGANADAESANIPATENSDIGLFEVAKATTSGAHDGADLFETSSGRNRIRSASTHTSSVRATVRWRPPSDGLQELPGPSRTSSFFETV